MSTLDRRNFLATGAAGLATGLGVAGHASGRAARRGPTFALVGAGGQGQGVMRRMTRFGRCVALCDVDSAHLDEATRRLAKHYRDRDVVGPAPATCEDYRKVLDDPTIDIVVVATPDHWHTKITVEALHAGKAVYCEKPLTLTIDEGRRIEKALDETGGVLAVGAQQRSKHYFQNAAALVRDGRLGTLRHVTCCLGTGPSSERLPAVSPPGTLNWNRWLGPAPYVPYRQASSLPDSGYGADRPHGRAHRHFRWWYEYSGGKLTDWGAHHVDFTLWALDLANADAGPMTIEPVSVTHPVPFREGYPELDDRLNTATDFDVRVTFAGGLVMDLRNDASDDLGFRNGVLFQGDAGRILVNRKKLVGKPVEEAAGQPVPSSVYRSLHPTANPDGQDHIENFFDAVEGVTTPITDARTHHRALSVCHAANLAMRLGRTLTFDPASQRFVDDDQANGLLARPARDGFQIDV